MALGPAQVHAHEHLGEVRGVDATSAGADAHDGLAGVPLPRQQGADLEVAEVAADAVEVLLGLLEGLDVVGAVTLGGHLDEHLEVVDARLHVDDAVELGLRLRESGRHLLRRVGVVPKVRRGGLVRELGDADLQRLRVGHGADGREGAAQGADL